MISTIPKLYEGTPTITVNDNRGLSVRQIQYNRTEVVAERDTLITRSVFNEIGNPTSFMDPRFFEKGQNNQSQAHNLAGQTLRIDSVDAGWRVALLDIEGAVHKEWNAHGTERRYEYDDELHRPIAIYEKNDDINNGVEQVTERFVYGTQEDMSNNLNLHLTRHYDLGGLSETDGISLSGGPLSQQRRLFKDVTAESNWKGEDESTWQSVLDTSIFKSKWTYNALGVQLTLQDAKNNIQRSEYGVSGQLVATYYQAIGKAEFAVLSSITYNANGQVLTETAGNGVVSCYTYDERDWRLVQATTTRPTKEGRNAQLQMLNYGYDPVGNIISIKDSAQATRFYKNQRIDPELTYTYDALYQLLTASGRENDAAISTSSLPSALIPLTDSHQYNGYTRQYHYDRSGNLESVQHSGISNYTQNMVISDTSNRVVQQTVNSPIRADNVNDYFDVHGNLKKLEHNKELSWGRYDQLKRVELTAQQSEVYQYTTQGDRIRKVLLDTGNSTETEVIYLPGLELRTTTNISNDSVKEELLVSVLMNTGRNQVRVQHWKAGLPSGLSNDQCRYSIDNHLGSSNLELDSEANILTQEEYYPFGGTAVWSAKSATEAKYKYVRYSGKERDATGLYYYGYRYYMPWMGRWLNPDPAWNIDGLNLYRMVRNNPVVLSDQDGRAADNKVVSSNQSSVLESSSRNISMKFNTLFDRIVHSAVSLNTRSVRNSVVRSGGTVTEQFSQVTGTVKSAILNDLNTSGGVCEALSAHWMKAHSEGGSLGSMLFSDGVAGDKKKLNSEGFKSVMNLQIKGMKANDQNAVTKDWLSANNLNSPGIWINEEKGKRTTSYRKGDTKRTRDGTKDLAQAIVDNGTQGKLYKKIDLIGPSNAHAVAAFVDDAHGVKFFDPNYGEFTFSDKETFTNWFTQEFWHKSRYDLPKFGLSGKFELLNIGVGSA